MLNELFNVDHNTEISVVDASGKAKQLWNENRIGRALRVRGFDVRVSGVTGSFGLVMRTHNLITNVGHAAGNARMSGQGSYGSFVNLALGTGSAAPAAADTALQAEITTGGLARGAATATQTLTNVANDTTQLVKTFTATSAFAVTEEGILDSPSTGGNLLAHQTFAAVNLNAGDSITVTHKYTS